MAKIDINDLCSKFNTNEMDNLLKDYILPYISYFEIIDRYHVDEKLRKKILDQQTVIVENKNETIYMVDDLYHREDGPAIISADAEEWWYKGFRHRVIGPAIQYKNGDREWFVDGKRHRVKGPAIIKDGQLEWWQNNMRYRENGPHVITEDGDLYWYNGTRQDVITSEDFYDDYYGNDRSDDYHPDEFYYYDEGEPEL